MSMLIKLFLSILIIIVSISACAEEKISYLGCQIELNDMRKFEVSDGSVYFLKVDEEGVHQSVALGFELVIHNYIGAENIENEYISDVEEYQFGKLTGHSLIVLGQVKAEQMFILSDLLENKSIMFTGFNSDQVNGLFPDCKILFP